MEALNKASNSERSDEMSPLEPEQDKTDKVVEHLLTSTVTQAKKMLGALTDVIDEDNATRVLRMIADLCTTNIAILTDLDPAAIRSGPRAKAQANGSPFSLSPTSIYEPMVAGGQNNETFGAQALGQMLALVPQIQLGQNVKGMTSALVEAKKAGLDDIAKQLEQKLSNTLGQATGEPEEMPEPEPESEGDGSSDVDTFTPSHQFGEAVS